MSSDIIIPGRGSVGSFDGIADVLAVALSNVCDNFAIVVSDWSRVWSIGTLLGTTVVHFVCTINADKQTKYIVSPILTLFLLFNVFWHIAVKSGTLYPDTHGYHIISHFTLDVILH